MSGGGSDRRGGTLAGRPRAKVNVGPVPVSRSALATSGVEAAPNMSTHATGIGGAAPQRDKPDPKTRPRPGPAAGLAGFTPPIKGSDSGGGEGDNDGGVQFVNRRRRRPARMGLGNSATLSPGAGVSTLGG